VHQEEKHLKSGDVVSAENLQLFAAASGWRETKQWTTNATPPFVFSPDSAEMVYGDDVVSGYNENGIPIRTGRLCRLALNVREAPHRFCSLYMTAAKYPAEGG